MASNRFGKGGVFTCGCCGRRTRFTTQWQTEAEFCGECEELMGVQNTMWDDGVETFVAEGGTKHRDALLAKIKTRGGDTDAVKAQMPQLFAAGA